MIKNTLISLSVAAAFSAQAQEIDSILFEIYTHPKGQELAVNTLIDKGSVLFDSSDSTFHLNPQRFDTSRPVIELHTFEGYESVNLDRLEDSIAHAAGSIGSMR